MPHSVCAGFMLVSNQQMYVCTGLCLYSSEVFIYLKCNYPKRSAFQAGCSSSTPSFFQNGSCTLHSVDSKSHLPRQNVCCNRVTKRATIMGTHGEFGCLTQPGQEWWRSILSQQEKNLLASIVLFPSFKKWVWVHFIDSAREQASRGKDYTLISYVFCTW